MFSVVFPMNYMKPKIIDNFLSKEELLNIKSTLLDSSFPWFYNDFILEKGSKECEDFYNYQFTHSFYMNDFQTSNYFSLVSPIITKLNIRSLLRIKANLTPRADKNILQGFHCDYDYPDSFTSIFYVNTNNGFTEFRDGTKINSIENRLVKFDAKTQHSGVTTTDEKVRCVININYF